MYIVIDQNLNVQQDVGIMQGYNYFTSLDEAFIAAIKDVEKVNGKDVLVHNWDKDTVHTKTTNRISNNRCIGSEHGVSYKSSYGEYTCARIILKLTEAK